MPPRKQQPRGISCSGKSVARCGEYILNGDDAFVWEDPDYDDSHAYEPLAEETDIDVDTTMGDETALEDDKVHDHADVSALPADEKE